MTIPEKIVTQVYYSGYHSYDTINGEGIRSSIFFSGCAHHCLNCFSPKTWDFQNGKPYTTAVEDKIINDLKNPNIPLSGISILGGDPLHPHNYTTVLSLCERVKKECTDKNIWLWTGYTIKQIQRDYRKEILDYLDVMIDGRYVDKLKDLTLLWRGSKNQRVYKINNGIPTQIL